ncbi:hypothetical protein KCV07_g4029, partial [Aureobasidium melanogenum]
MLLEYLTRCELWVGWQLSLDASVPPELRFYGDRDDSIEGRELKIVPDLCQYIQWHDSFEKVLKMPRMDNIRQDAHFLAIARVRARYPGLVCERDPDCDRYLVKGNGST